MAKNSLVPPQDCLIRWCIWLERQIKMKDGWNAAVICFDLVVLAMQHTLLKIAVN